eukprot:366122-Chlamydomonas_euryale.AAC.10
MGSKHMGSNPMGPKQMEPKQIRHEQKEPGGQVTTAGRSHAHSAGDWTSGYSWKPASRTLSQATVFRGLWPFISAELRLRPGLPDVSWLRFGHVINPHIQPSRTRKAVNAQTPHHRVAPSRKCSPTISPSRPDPVHLFLSVNTAPESRQQETAMPTSPRPPSLPA